jgi:sugar phosphate isomerase/epimerase
VKKISTEINSIARIVGDERAVEYVARAGFDAFDFSMFGMGKYDWKNKSFVPTDHPLAGSDYLAFARKIKQIGLDNGIKCNQSHAPFPVICPEIRGMLKKAIECTAEAGGEICVIHPDAYSGPEENAEMYLELLPFAKDCGVRIATENMWDWDKVNDHATKAACSHHDDFLAHIKAVNDPYLVACLDIGHAEMRGLDTDAPTMIRTLGDSLAALHIHDNDKWKDSHGLPFTMQIDFDAVMKALKEINYVGDITLEADAYLKNHTENNVFEGVLEMARVARRLAEMYEKA